MADPGRDELPGLLDAVARRSGCAPAVAAALLWKQYAWYVVDAALAGWTTGPIPDLGLEATAVRLENEGASLSIRLGPPDAEDGAGDGARGGSEGAGGAGAGGTGVGSGVGFSGGSGGRFGGYAVAGSGEREFAGWFRTEVVKAHLTPILEHLHNRTRAGRRLLWGSVTHAVALPLSQRLPDPQRSVPELLDRIGPPVAGLVVVGADAVVRRTCCLAFRMATPVLCDYCPIRTADCSPLPRTAPETSGHD